MIKEVNQKINKINKKIGLNMEIPLPSRRTLEINEKVNIATSVTCLSIGMLTTSKWLIGIGILSGISATFTHVEKKKL
ncbi:hypothetical protein [Vagococcus fluvialis]|uniref:Uncharacterized protein n=1 Tax=Vagococcus fluvialis TaxID=2738 RepID=A0A369B302_9ENTE|nr:hypothetical protein [Vagococcus fluvialis]MDT2747918.1 hypothetical protein [Vagococcus fluvialis]RCX14968.1 hypothetical protein DFR54_10226 [Vagococcus fluvialis]RSU05739.1 hypothetical protein CBF32_01710 [Vagococcus fluvialis]UDM74644.1 hypothetical protein K5K99_03460 [Vagococcus fluvialis]